MTITPVHEVGIDIPVHPIAALLPLIEGVEFAALVANILAHGQRIPCIILEVEPDDGTKVMVLVDGRNRWRACRVLGIEPKTQVYREEWGPVGDYIIIANVVRRHMDPGQIAVVVAQAIPFIAEEAEARKKATQFAPGVSGNPEGRPSKEQVDLKKDQVDLKSGPPAPPSGRDIEAKHASSTAGQVAAKAKVSRYRAEQALKLVNEAPALAAEVATGRMKLKDAVRQLAPPPSPLPPPQVPPAPAAAAPAIVPPEVTRIPLALPRAGRWDGFWAAFWVPMIVCLALCAGLGFVIWRMFS